MTQSQAAAIPTPDPTCEFTATGGQVKLSVSRRRDRVRLESADGKGTICVGPLLQPTGTWTILVPQKRAFFVWTPTRSADAETTLADSRAFEAMLNQTYVAPGGLSLLGLPDAVRLARNVDQKLVGERP